MFRHSKPSNFPKTLLSDTSSVVPSFKSHSNAIKKLDLPVPYVPIKENVCMPARNEEMIFPITCCALGVTMYLKSLSIPYSIFTDGVYFII